MDVVALDVNEAQGEPAFLRSKDAPLEEVLQTPQDLAPCKHRRKQGQRSKFDHGTCY